MSDIKNREDVFFYDAKNSAEKSSDDSQKTLPKMPIYLQKSLENGPKGKQGVDQ